VQDRFDAARLCAGAPEFIGERLVVNQVHHRHAVGLDPVAHRHGRVMKKLCSDPHPADRVDALGQVVVGDRSRELVQLDRKVGEFHLTGEHVMQRAAAAFRAMDRNRVPFDKSRSEEGETLDVIPVRVSQENVRVDGFLASGHQVGGEGPRAGAAIENQQVAVGGGQFDAGGVAAEAIRAWPGAGDRASCPPETYSHGSAPPSREQSSMRNFSLGVPTTMSTVRLGAGRIMCVTARTTSGAEFSLGAVVKTPRQLSRGVRHYLGYIGLKTNGASHTPDAETALLDASVAYLRGPRQRISIATALRWLQQAVARVQQLERALASSQQEAIVAQQQLAMLTETYASLSELAVRREHEVASARHFAYHDELTGLPNRALLLDRLSQALARAKRHNKQLAILLLDLDGFKDVNDRLGLVAGDKLLQRVSERLLSCIRGSDTACRYGGDEFVVLLPEVDDQNRALMVAGEIHARLANPYMVDDYSIGVTASIGVAVYPVDGTSQDDLIRRADVAMYLAKPVKGIPKTHAIYSQPPAAAASAIR
jgi:diguanylate cyclase (GGDEF)-like protein